LDFVAASSSLSGAAIPGGRHTHNMAANTMYSAIAPSGMNP
jgi:hypothetical protein